MSTPASPDILWTPSKAFQHQSNLQDFVEWLKETKRLEFEDYHSLWQWSVEQPAAFWRSVATYFEVIFHEPYEAVKGADPMPYTQWFEGSTLNYAEHIFRMATEDHPAIIYQQEGKPLQEMSWADLNQSVASMVQWLQTKGVGKGDRVVAFLPNVPEATIGFLAACAIGAVWSSCSPDFGSSSVVDRFQQIEPKILLACKGYSYGGKYHDRLEVVKALKEALPTLETIVLIGGESMPELQATSWEDTQQYPDATLEFVPVPFSHPIWVLFSSGTTGKPKAITHSQGGVLLEHLKYLAFHNDLKPGERFFWFTTTGWMMWNFLQAALLRGATIVLYDGSPSFPNLSALWKLTDQVGIHHFGTSAPFLVACMKRNIETRFQGLDFSQLRSIGSTGAPLPPEAFDWVYEKLRPEVWLCSMSGGTDLCTAFVGGCPWEPVYRGEIQVRCLGASLYAWDEAGEPVIGEVGEMVLTQSMPSMPIYFWNDPERKRYLSSYFDYFPGVWRHGDWILITERNSLIILGRSDATLNRQGIRIGTAEIYQSVDQVQGIKDALIVNLELDGGRHFMPLFVQLEADVSLTEPLKSKIRKQLKEDYSPRHVPDDILEIPDIPYTISGKKLEAPVKKILMGFEIDKVANPDAMRNPESLDFFVAYSRQLKKK